MAQYTHDNKMILLTSKEDNKNHENKISITDLITKAQFKLTIRQAKDKKIINYFNSPA